MKHVYEIKVTWIDPITKKETIEEFASIYQCAMRFQISPTLMKKIIEGQSHKKNVPLEQNAKFEVIKVHVREHHNNWHCDICDKDYLPTSKGLHLVSIHHRDNVLGHPHTVKEQMEQLRIDHEKSI